MKTNMRDISKKLLLCVVIALGLSACNAETNAKAINTEVKGQTQTSVAATKSENKEKDKNQMILQGRVIYNDFEGGFYGFIADNGKKYTPMNLPLEHRKNGLILQMQAEIMKDMMTTTQYGELIKVSDVKIIDDSKVKEVNTSKY